MTELNLQIEELITKGASDFEISKLFKKSIKEYLNSLDDIFNQSQGKDFFVKHTKKIDSFLIILYKYILRKHFGSYQPMSNSIPITLVALGSYGREQLCVYSDIDLMLLYKDIPGYNIKPILEEFLTLIWDADIKLGHRVHEISQINDVVKEDITIKTSIIESRMIYGSKHLWYNFQNVLYNVRNENIKEFITLKIDEHKMRLLKYPLNMQPNIKDGYGGMREANMLFWISNVIFGVSQIKDLSGRLFNDEEYRKFRSSLEFVFRVRNALHLIAKKKLDKVNLDILPELSSKLGFKDTKRLVKERQCMSKLFESLHTIHWFSTIMIKKIIRPYIFQTSNISLLKAHRYKKQLYIHDRKLYTSFHKKPKKLNLFIKELISLPDNINNFDRAYINYASKTIVPSKQSKELKNSISLLLQKKNLYPLIKLIYNAGLFRAILPSMKKTINQPQFDGYHIHPVDIHSLQTLKYIENIKDAFVKNLYNSLTIEEQSLLKLIALFHDAGKGRGTDHHISGESIFRKFANNINMDESMVSLGARIIRYHNLMSHTATQKDIYSQKVILKFNGLLKTEQSLRLLYVQTYADISAVGENIYKSSTANLLNQLFIQSLMAFENEDLVKESSMVLSKQNAIKRHKNFKILPNILQKKIVKMESNQIYVKEKVLDIINIGIWAKDIKNYEYKILNNDYLTIQIIRANPINLGYLLGKLSNILNISSMEIYKLYDGKKFFEVKFDESIDQNDLIFIEEIINSSFDMTKTLKLKKPFILKDEIEINCDHTEELAELAIKTKDQKGLFAYIAKVFDDFNIEIESAKIHTSKDKVRDLILIEKNGHFCPNQETIVNLLTTDKS